MHLQLSCPTHIKSGVGWDYWDLQDMFDKFPTLGMILCNKSPTFCIGIPELMKIFGQMPHPWGEITLTNHYKSPLITQPGVGRVDNDRCIIPSKSLLMYFIFSKQFCKGT